MATLLPHKQALYEIFQAEIEESDGLLYNKCEGVLYTAVDKLPHTNTWNTFIVLGDYEADDVVMGWNTERCRVYVQAIHVLSLVTSQILEYQAESSADEVARIVRQILRANQILACTTYVSGIAIESYLRASKSEFTQFWDLRANMQTIILNVKIKET